VNLDGYRLYISISEFSKNESEMEAYYKAFRQEIVQTLLKSHIKEGSRILDMGCQFGDMSLPLAPIVGSLVGLDLLAHQIERAIDNARSHNIANALFLVGDAGSLPFQPSSFDIILFLEVIEHITDATPALAEIRRVLKPGGLLLIGTPQKTGLINVIPHFLTGLFLFLLKTLVILRSRNNAFFAELYNRGLRPPHPKQRYDSFPPKSHLKAGHVRKYRRRELIKILRTQGFQFVKETGVALFLTRMIKYDFVFPWLIRIYKRLFNPGQSFLLSRFGNQMYLLFRYEKRLTVPLSTRRCLP